MAEEAANTNGQTDPNAPQFAPQAVYLKDVSFESPAGPRVPANTAAPTIGLNMNTSVSDLSGELKEVVLSVRVEAQAGDKTMWLVELQQAGAFGIRNVPAEDLQRLLGIFCPTYLLPFARQTISDLLTKGGFPQFLLPAVNFEALFNQALARAQQEQLQQGQAGTPAN